ncbi:MAG TPA: hypothetical protein VGM01_10580 [Ktedonobacteraceae bacterium]|jgi:hypothetical protein
MPDRLQEHRKDLSEMSAPLPSDEKNALTDTQVAVSPTPEDEGEYTEKKNFLSLNAVIETSLIILGLLAIFFLLPRDTGGDGWIRYQALLVLLSHHIPHINYSLIGPSFALPLVWIGKKLNHAYDWVLVYNQILFAASLLISYLLLRKYMDRALLRKFYLLLIIASMFAAHLSLFYGEVFTALCVGFGVLIAYLRFAAPASWLVVALGIANTPAALGGLALLLLKRVMNAKRLRYLLVFIVAVALIGLNNWFQHGNPLNAGYIDDRGFKTIMPYSGLPGFSYPFFFGLLSLLFSFGKGLLFFAPGLLLPVRKALLRGQQREQVPLYEVYTLWIAFVIGLLLVYARWWAWYGGMFWGPRFLLFASIPASFALAVRLRYYKETSLGVNLLTFAIFILSVWVCINGAIYQWVTSLQLPTVCTQNHDNLEMICYYIPEFSGLWLPFVHHYALNIQQELFIGYVVLASVYLIIPLCILIVRQASELLRKYSKIYLTPKAWRI